MTAKLTRKQERLYHELLNAWHYGEEPRITREYVLKTYPTDKEANKRLNEGLRNFDGFVENAEEKERKHIEHNFPGLTQYGCTDPLQDYGDYSKDCEHCPRRKECERDVVWTKKILDNFGRTRDAEGHLESDRKKRSVKSKIQRKPIKKIVKKVVKKCRCKK